MARSLQLAELLDSQRESGSLTDVVLVCGKKDFPAHKNVLSARSNYFRAMFTTRGWDENGKGRIKLQNVKPEEMEIILSFLYTGNIKNVENPSLLKTLLKTSHMLEINELFEYCYKEICKGLTSSYFLEIYDLAEVYSNEEMMMYVVSFLAQHFTSISRSEEFLKLSTSQLQKIIQHPNICKTPKDDVIKGLLLWAEVDTKREEILSDILTILDLKDISKEFLTHLLREHALVKKNVHILTLLTAEATSRLLVKTESGPQLFCFGEDDEKQMLSIYNIKENQWLPPKRLPFNLDGWMSVVWFSGNIYIFGGDQPSAKVIKYNPLGNKVASIGKLKTPVCCAGVGVLDEFIYLVNGLNEKEQDVRMVQRYCPAVGKSYHVAKTNFARCRPAVVSHLEYLYVFGDHVNDVERYDPRCNEWTVITAIPGEMTWCMGDIVQENLFVIIPCLGNYKFQVYDFVANSWAKLKIDGSPKRINKIFGTRLAGKSVLLVCDDAKTCHVYDPESGQWIRQSEPNTEPWDNELTCLSLN